MKKIRALSLVMVIILAFCPFITPVSVQAAIPTQLSITYAKTAPVIDGVVDASYGEMQWDQSATDFEIGEFNLFPRLKEEWDLEQRQAILKKMNMKGWLAYDKEGIYMAVEATDILAMSNSDPQKFWNSTNIQVVIYIDSHRYYFTLYYGENKKAVLRDDKSRSDLDESKVVEYTLKETSFENGIKLGWEIKIPYEALYNSSRINQNTDIRLGVVQTSMSYGYYSCQAFGEAYSLNYQTLVPVKVNSKVDENYKPADPDFDNDGRLTITDFIVIMNNFQNAYTVDDAAYDVSGDGWVDEEDLAFILIELLEMY